MIIIMILLFWSLPSVSLASAELGWTAPFSPASYSTDLIHVYSEAGPVVFRAAFSQVCVYRMGSLTL